MNESGKKDGVINMNDSVNVGNLLPITPKPKTTHNTNTTPLPYSTNCIHTRSTNNVVGLNGHLGNQISEQNRREFHEEPLMGSSRWNPTAEQLLALEEMYRRGTRTPTADQIQHIASQLRRFGKIEGKNVFYWFQNHKARERQKRRREAETSRKLPKHDHVETLHNQDSGMRAVFQLELKKTLSLSVPPSYCCENLEGPFSMHRAATAESTITKNGWSQLEEKIFHHHKNYTWHDMDLYPSSPIQFINNMNTTRTSSRFLNFQNKNASFKPRWIETDETNNVDGDRVTEEVELAETLELFPLCSNSEESEGLNINDREVPIRTINTKMNNPNKYFEFLPVKK